MGGLRIPFAKRWPCRPIPQDDELLTSYIYRAAQGCNLKPFTFLHGYFGSSPSLLSLDLDSHLQSVILEQIAVGSGLPKTRIREMMLEPLAEKLCENVTPKGHKAWILPTAPFSTNRRRPGQQFCPICLREDATPYLRRSWRLGFVTACVKHGTLLLDRCPYCKSILHAHRSVSMRRCFQCRRDLSRITTSAVDAAMLDFQARLEVALDEDWIEIRGKPVYVRLWFTVLRRFCTLAVNGQGAKRYVQAVADAYGGDPSAIEKGAPKDPIEVLSTLQRHQMLDLARRVLEDFPNRLIPLCRSLSMTRSRIIQDMTNVPFMLDEVLKEYLDDKPYCASEAEVAAAAAYLRRKNGVASYKDLRAHCGESRYAIYKHMDYTREITAPSWWRYASVAGPTQLSTRALHRSVQHHLEGRDLQSSKTSRNR